MQVFQISGVTEHFIIAFRSEAACNEHVFIDSKSWKIKKVTLKWVCTLAGRTIGADYIKMDLRKMGWVNAGWTEMAQDSFQWTACFKYINIQQS
jgi:hypothetical protein